MLKIHRYNPQADTAIYDQTYVVPLDKEKINLLQALEYIYREQDDSLTFRRYCCGLHYCNSCMMLLNGRKVHACLTVVEPGSELDVGPLPGRRVLRDLISEDQDEDGFTNEEATGGI